ncbi:hypothetical protein H0H93_002058 [Arthromyces matolae]|nr:hypothetical protein H0H93_002058 [Arthromyces matolae]
MPWVSRVATLRAAVLTVEVADAAEVRRDLGTVEEAVRNAVDASLVVAVDIGREVFVATEREDATDALDVGLEPLAAAVRVVGVFGGRSELLASVKVLLRIVETEATERTEAAEERTEAAEDPTRFRVAFVEVPGAAFGRPVVEGAGETFLITTFLGRNGAVGNWL